MTVRELIRLLQSFDPDDKVLIPVSSWGLGIARKIVSGVTRRLKGEIEIF